MILTCCISKIILSIKIFKKQLVALLKLNKIRQNCEKGDYLPMPSVSFLVQCNYLTDHFSIFITNQSTPSLNLKSPVPVRFENQVIPSVS